MLNGLDLFSGIGGIALALAPWVQPVAYCEIDAYARSVLLSRQHSGQLPIAPIWDDVRTLSSGDLPPAVDIITGGFPCQDISVAGAGKGLAGERSGLFYEIARLCGDLRPTFVYLENVPAITTRGGLEVVGTLTAMGYDCRWCVIPSGHGLNGFRGNRWFLLAKAQSTGLEVGGECRGDQAQKPMLAGKGETSWLDLERPAVKPGICGIAYGLPNRVDRLRGLGNAVVPLQARRAFEILSGLSVEEAGR